MTLLQIISQFDEVESIVTSLFDFKIDKKSDAIIPPLNTKELYKIKIILNASFTEIQKQIISEMINIANSPNISDTAYKLNEIFKGIHESSRILERLEETRATLYKHSVVDGLHKDELLHYLAIIEELTGNLMGEITIIKIQLNEMISIINRAKEKHASHYSISKILCPITGNHCNKKISQNTNEVFIAYQFTSDYYNSASFKTMINEALDKFNLKAFFPDEHYEPNHISCEICHKIQESTMCIFEISDSNPNVLFELGLSYMLGKISILLAQPSSKGTKISDIAGIHRIQYSDLIQCRETIKSYLDDSRAIKNLIESQKEVASTHESIKLQQL